MAYFCIAPDQGGVPIPNSPFPADSWIYIRVPDGATPTFEIIAKPPLVNPQDPKSSAFGHPTDQDVWAFKANRLACCAAALSALTQEMQQTVTPLNKQVWYDSINVIAPQMAQLSTLTKTMCTKVSETVNK